MCDAKIGLAWSAYYEDAKALAARLLNYVQPEFTTLSNDLTAHSESILVFVNEWIDETTAELASLREFLNESHHKSKSR